MAHAVSTDLESVEQLENKTTCEAGMIFGEIEFGPAIGGMGWMGSG